MQNHQKTMNKMAIVSPHLPLVTFNGSGLNFLTKRHRMADWIKKADTKIQQSVAYKRLASALRTHTG